MYKYCVIIEIDDFGTDEKGLIDVYQGKRIIQEEYLQTKNEVSYFLDHFNLLNPHVRYEVYDHESGENISEKFYFLPYGTVMYED